MTISKVVLENFKSHSRTEIPLRPLTVLVGPNSVGKTSVLEAIERVVRVGTPERSSWFREFESSSLRRGTQRCAVTLSEESTDPKKLWLSLDRVGAVIPISKISVGWEQGGNSSDHSFPPSKIWSPDPEIAAVTQAMVGVGIQLRLDAEALAAPSTIMVGETTTTLSPSGRGLAGVLALMQLFHPARFSAVVESVRKIVPSLQGIRIQPTKFRETRTFYDEHDGSEERSISVDGADLRFDFIGAEDIAANAVSEGTLIALGILTVAYQSNERCLILLDDIERALHPRAQRELIRMLRQIIADNPQLQIIATSHSPYLVDEFEPEEVIVFAQRKDGSSAARPLSEHPRIKQALEVLTTGEFLAAEEEAWVTGESDG